MATIDNIATLDISLQIAVNKDCRRVAVYVCAQTYVSTYHHSRLDHNLKFISHSTTLYTNRGGRTH